LSFGKWGGFPFKFGGTQQKPSKVEHRALLAAMEPALDPTDGTVHAIETFAEARTLGMIWGAGKRLANQAIPARMLEALPDQEQILKIIPTPGTTDNERRDAVAAKQRGLAGNTMVDIEAALRKLLGRNFEEILYTPREDVVAYWPGGIPGPPGYEWTSSKAHIGIRVNLNGLSPGEGQKLGAKLFGLLDTMIPAWMSYSIGVGSEFVLSKGMLGITFL